jgi:hypothetical protein
MEICRFFFEFSWILVIGNLKKHLILALLNLWLSFFGKGEVGVWM